MKKGTVTIGIDEYNELRDFKKNIEEGKVINIYGSYEWGLNYKALTGNEAVLEIAKANEQLVKEHRAVNDANFTKLMELDKIKKMSFWQWRKWRKS